MIGTGSKILGAGADRVKGEEMLNRFNVRSGRDSGTFVLGVSFGLGDYEVSLSFDLGQFFVRFSYARKAK